MSMLSGQADRLRKMAEWDGVDAVIARELRDAADIILKLRDDLQRANAENANLREEAERARDPQRIGGQADPSSFVYAIEQLREFRWQHATNDEDAIPYINNVAAAHERENAKLRELVLYMWDFSCVVPDEPHASKEELDYSVEVWKRMRELGIKVRHV